MPVKNIMNLYSLSTWPAVRATQKISSVADEFNMQAHIEPSTWEMSSVCLLCSYWYIPSGILQWSYNVWRSELESVQILALPGDGRGKTLRLEEESQKFVETQRSWQMEIVSFILKIRHHSHSEYRKIVVFTHHCSSVSLLGTAEHQPLNFMKTTCFPLL